MQTWTSRTTKETYPESKRASAKPGTKEGVFQRAKRWFCSDHTRSEPWSFGASYSSICVTKRKPCPCSLLLAPIIISDNTCRNYFTTICKVQNKAILLQGKMQSFTIFSAHIFPPQNLTSYTKYYDPKFVLYWYSIKKNYANFFA